MLAHLFRHRSGRVIALSRLLLSAVFLTGIFLDPGQPHHRPDSVYVLLAAYVLWAAIVLALTWSNWWRDYRLSVIAHAIDVGAFGVIVYYTEGYTSPFYTFFVFLILSAAIRWSRRETTITAIVVLLFFMGSGTAAIFFGGEQLQAQGLIIRTGYLVVLSILLIWFGANQPNVADARRMAHDIPEFGSTSIPIDQVLQLARRRLRAGRATLAWWQREEPWLNVSEEVDGQVQTERLRPDRYPLPIVADAHQEPFLYDILNDRALQLGDGIGSQPHLFHHPINPAFARAFSLSDGIVIRLRAREFEGELFAMEIPGLCIDDLVEASLLGDSAARMFDRSSMLATSEESAVARAKASLARDLHDSVVQVLAGTAFRLEALRSWIKAGRDPDPEIEQLKAALSTEQRKVREFVAGLRSGRDPSPPLDLRAGMRKLAEELKQRWDVNCELKMSEVLPASASMEHEIQQIIREAAANAKRHGSATMLRLDLDATDEDLSIRIQDDGKGFPIAGEFDDRAMADLPVRPWSVHERVKRLGGSLQLRTGTGGTELSIQLPIGPFA